MEKQNASESRHRTDDEAVKHPATGEPEFEVIRKASPELAAADQPAFVFHAG